MRLMIYVGDEGPLDIDFKDGDIWGWRDDSWVPTSNELKKWLVIQVPEYQNDKAELVASEYVPGAGSSPSMRHQRKYFVPYWEKLTPEELAAARNKTVEVPIVTDTFGIWDITRKN